MQPVEVFIANNPQDILSIDEADVEDVQSCAKYIKEIYTNLLLAEDQIVLSKDFIKRQQYIDADDRITIIDWVSRAHSKFNLANESFFHYVALFDKLLEKIQIHPYDARLIGVACLLIASKYEQSYIPSLRHYVEVVYQESGLRYVCCQQCVQMMQQKHKSTNFRSYASITNFQETPQDILDIQNQLEPCQQCSRAALIQVEEEILHALNFYLALPTPLVFLRRYTKISNMKARDRYIAFYLGELCMLNSEMLEKYKSSLIAAGCVAMTRRLTKHTSWCDELTQFSGYTEENVRETLQDISTTLKKLVLSPKTKYIKRKYAQPDRFYGVSMLIENVVKQAIGTNE